MSDDPWLLSLTEDLGSEGLCGPCAAQWGRLAGFIFPSMANILSSTPFFIVTFLFKLKNF